MEGLYGKRVTHFDIKKKPKKSLIKKADDKLIGELIIIVFEPSKFKFVITSFSEYKTELIINCKGENKEARSFYAKHCCLMKYAKPVKKRKKIRNKKNS